MSERKVLNKYYPPDFDPTNIPRMKLPKARQYTVRIMAPCNMKCNTCGDYIAKAKKFNARKETVQGEEYLGLKVFRFYIKCPICMAEITFKTDPRNQDYELEHGATRNFQALRLAEMQAKKEAEEKEEEEKLNPMKMLENRTKASKKEMQDLEDLEELRELSNRTVNLDTEEFLKKQEEDRKKMLQMIREQEEREDEALLQKMLKEQNNLLGIEIDGSDESDEESSKEGGDEREDEREGEEQEGEEEEDDLAGEVKASTSTSAIANEQKQVKQPKSLSSNTDLAEVPRSKRKQLAGLIRVVKKKQVIAKDDSTSKSLAIASLCQYSDSDSE